MRQRLQVRVQVDHQGRSGNVDFAVHPAVLTIEGAVVAPGRHTGSSERAHDQRGRALDGSEQLVGREPPWPLLVRKIVRAGEDELRGLLAELLESEVAVGEDPAGEAAVLPFGADVGTGAHDRVQTLLGGDVQEAAEVRDAGAG